jgi:RND family efflux transporter MFP subunit
MDNTQAMENQETKKSSAKILVLLLTLLLAAGAGIGFYFVQRGANNFVTDNARVTTTLIAITPTLPGVLERFTVYEGQYVFENEILGWVENDEAMRSPVDGLVIHTNAVQNQAVSGMEPVAVIADINDIHIFANVEETDIARIEVGQAAFVTIDTFGNRQFTGYVREVGNITAAELTGNAVFFNTGGNFTRVTHLIPIRINLVDDIILDNVIGVNARVRIPLRQTGRDLPPVVGTRAVRPSALDRGITVRGIVESVQRRNVYTTLGYMVERVYVEAGDRVTEGQVLGVLDTVDLNIQLVNAEASLRMAEVDVAMAEHNHGMMRSLYDVNAIPRNDFLQAEFALQSAMAFRQQAQAMLDIMRIALERSVITSPINGTVTAVIAREGSVGMGLLFTVEDDNLRIITSFREHDLARVQAGMEVVITSDATGDWQYSGIISRINPAATVGMPVAVFEAEILVTSSNTDLRIGMNTRINIALE